MFNNIVLLIGQVPSKEVKDKLAKEISKLKHVRVVYDELTVGPIIPLSSYANDAWVTSKVKSRFIGKVNMLHFKVVTSKGIVYLMGLTTKKEGALAAEIASKTSGVKKVVEIYAYLPEKPKGDAKVVEKHTQDTTSKS